ncbi:hypothetical protein L0F63_005996, partial [Massospora cicadina]
CQVQFLGPADGGLKLGLHLRSVENEKFHLKNQVVKFGATPIEDRGVVDEMQQDLLQVGHQKIGRD